MTDLDDVIATLLHLMRGSESDSARIAAAKILLERLAPKTDEETARREKEEREAAFTEARILLAEFAALKSATLQPAAAEFAGLQQSDALVAEGAARADHTAG